MCLTEFSVGSQKRVTGTSNINMSFGQSTKPFGCNADEGSSKILAMQHTPPNMPSVIAPAKLFDLKSATPTTMSSACLTPVAAHDSTPVNPANDYMKEVRLMAEVRAYFDVSSRVCQSSHSTVYSGLTCYARFLADC